MSTRFVNFTTVDGRQYFVLTADDDNGPVAIHRIDENVEDNASLLRCLGFQATGELLTLAVVDEIKSRGISYGTVEPGALRHIERYPADTLARAIKRNILPGGIRVHVELHASPEDMPLRGNLFTTGDDEADEAIEDMVIERRLEGDEWAWCCAQVRAVAELGDDCETVLAESEYLGGCSYGSAKDFIENSGYYEDMVDAAIERLTDAIERIRNDNHAWWLEITGEDHDRREAELQAPGQFDRITE